MNPPTMIIALVLLVIVGLIIGRGIYNRRHRKGGGCGCGCEGCPSSGFCHGTSPAQSPSNSGQSRTRSD